MMGRRQSMFAPGVWPLIAERDWWHTVPPRSKRLANQAYRRQLKEDLRRELEEMEAEGE